MTIQLNGEPRDTAAATISALIDELPLPAQAALVEHNGEPLRRDEWPTRPIAPGDQVEVIRIVAGG